MTGYFWVTNVAIAALSSFFITGLGIIGPFSPIHGLSVFALWGLCSGLRQARAGRVTAHRAAMASIYWWAIGLAGLLTLLPGRRINHVLFGENQFLGHWVIGATLGAAMLSYWFKRRRARSRFSLHKRPALR